MLVSREGEEKKIQEPCTLVPVRVDNINIKKDAFVPQP